MIIWKNKLLKFILQLFCFIGWCAIFSSPCYALLLSLTNVPEIINQNQEFKVHFRYEVLNPNQKYYLRPCFYITETNDYFGCIKNNSDQWVCGSQSDKTQYYEIQTDGQGIWEGDLDIKADDGGGEFSLKIRRYTSNGSPEDSNSEILVIDTAENSPSPFPSPSPVSYPGNIFLSEFMACPSDAGKEWIEIYNDNDSQVELNNWFIRDSTESEKVGFSCTISGKGFCKIEMSRFLNNSGGDTVRLFNPEKELESYSYSDCDSSYSWSKVNGSWCKTNLTPEAKNSDCLQENKNSPNPSPSASPPPTMNPSPSVSPSPKASKSPSPSSSSSPFPSEESGEVLGEIEETEPSPSPEEVTEKKKLDFSKILALIFIIPGLGLLGGTGFYFYKETKKQKKQKLLTEQLDS